jgi:hypothetical protein
MSYPEAAILENVRFLQENAEALSKSRNSGVAKVYNYLGTNHTVYRAHIRDVLPNIIANSTRSAAIAELLVDSTLADWVEFDSSSLWFTVKTITM